MGNSCMMASLLPVLDGFARATVDDVVDDDCAWDYGYVGDIVCAAIVDYDDYLTFCMFTWIV